MNIKWTIKKYKKASNKARKLWEKIDTFYMGKYMDNDRETCKQIINEIYDGVYAPVYRYADTDSILSNLDLNKQET